MSLSWSSCSMAFCSFCPYTCRMKYWMIRGMWLEMRVVASWRGRRGHGHRHGGLRGQRQPVSIGHGWAGERPRLGLQPSSVLWGTPGAGSAPAPTPPPWPGSPEHSCSF